MKVLIILKIISRDTGGSSSALDLAETLKLAGHDVKIMVSRNYLYYILKGRKRFLTDIKLGDIYYYELRKISDTKFFRKNDSRENIFKFFAKSLAKHCEFIYGIVAKKRSINLIMNQDLIIDAALSVGEVYEKIKKSNAYLLYNHAGDPDIYINSWLHNVGYTPDESNLDEVEVYKSFCNRFDGLLFQSESQRIKCEEKGLPNVALFCLPPSTKEQDLVRIIGNSKNLFQKKHKIVCVGSLQERKGQILALEVLKVLKNDFTIDGEFELIFVGGGIGSEYHEKLLSYTLKNDLADNVIFYGHRNDYLSFIEEADILIQTSYAEGVSRVLRESMFLKTPVVSFCISGTTGLLCNEDTAILIPPYDIMLMAEGIKKILKNDVLRSSIIKNAYSDYLLFNSRSCYLSNVAKIMRQIEKKIDNV